MTLYSLSPMTKFTPVSGMIDVLPTGTCYDDCIEYMSEAWGLGQLDILLCHGIIGNPRQHSHAWLYCPSENEVSHFGIVDGEKVRVTGTKQELYTSLQVMECTYYSIQQMLYYNWRFNNYGPWEQKYVNACKDYSDQVISPTYERPNRELVKIFNMIGVTI